MDPDDGGFTNALLSGASAFPVLDEESFDGSDVGGIENVKED